MEKQKIGRVYAIMNCLMLAILDIWSEYIYVQ